MTATLLPQLDDYITRLIQDEEAISAARKQTLASLTEYIRSNADLPVLLNFICTHNSRRSHIAQIWAAVAAYHYGLRNVQTYSGGTEATAFNPRAVAAMKRAGFQIENEGGENPRYRVIFADDQPPLTCWSKTFDDPANPGQEFAAIMTCNHADENCPLIPGVKRRIPLTYNDPKEADDTPEEASRYDERVWQIGREIFFAMKQVQG